MTGANAASCSSAKGHVIELGVPIGDHASELTETPRAVADVVSRRRIMEATNRGRGIAGKEGQSLASLKASCRSATQLTM
jgi:hypothetical protein